MTPIIKTLKRNYEVQNKDMNKINKIQIEESVDTVISEVLDLLKLESFYIPAIFILLFGNLSLLKC